MNIEETKEAMHNLLRKHKIVGAPVKEEEKKEETKEEALKTLKKEKFFRNIEESEKMGILIGYDELIEYEKDPKVSLEKEKKEISDLIFSLFSDDIDSFFLCTHNGKMYLHLKYTKVLNKIRIGPVVTSEKETEEEKNFKNLWKDKIEHRRFEDGKIRVCVSFQPYPQHAMPYLLLSKIFSIKTVGEKISSENAKREGKLLNPVISLENLQDTYSTHNRADADEYIRKALDGVRDILPVKILEVAITGSLARKTRIFDEKRAHVYLRLAKQHQWPTHSPELFSSTITALNGVLGKYLTQKNSKVEGISPSQTLYVEIRKEKIELIFDIEEEKEKNMKKYSAMNFRLEFDRFIQEIARENKVFPEVCALIKQLLFSHGLYPYHISDKTVELLCFRTASQCRTVEGAFKSAISTQYSYGYAADIRREKKKIRAKNNGKISVIHAGGHFEYLLPEKEVFDKMNTLFRTCTAQIEASPGIDANFGVSSLFKTLFVPSTEDISFSLSRVPAKGYTEINHHKKELGGNIFSSSSEYCFNALHELHCIPYFCGTNKLYVKAKNTSTIPLAIGMSATLTGMKYIKRKME